jgi:hypothetical protein
MARQLRLLQVILFLGFICLMPLANAQQDALGSWNIINVRYAPTEKLSFFGEAQLRSLRFYNHFHYYEYKMAANYKLTKGVQLTIGAGSYQTYREGGNFKLPKNNNEFRLWPQVVLNQELAGVKIEQRYRSELRWTSSGYRNRFRYRLGSFFPLGKERDGYKPYQLSISNEIFFSDREPYFERNRLQLAFNYIPSRHTTVQIGYLHQFDYRINDEIGRDFLVIGYYIELFKGRGVQKIADPGIRED